MFKRKVWISRVLALCLATALIMPTVIYAVESNPEVTEQPQDQGGSGEPESNPVEISVPVSELIESESPVNPNTETEVSEESEETTTSGESESEIPSESVAPGESESETPSESAAPDESESEMPSESTTPGESESETPSESTSPGESESEMPSESTTPSESESETPSESETQESEAPVSSPLHESGTLHEQTSGTGSNADLLASLQLVIPPFIEDSFRFITIDKVYAIVLSNDVNVYDSYVESEDPILVGTLQQDNLCYIIKEVEGSDWIYIESGVVRGFVRAEFLLTGEAVDALASEKGEEDFTFAEALVEPIDNRALAYTKTTTQQTVIDKVYAIANIETVNIYEGKDTTSQVVGELSDGALCYIIADAEEDWIFIESNDVRGFIEKESLIQGDEADALVLEAGEENLEQAEEIIPIEENKACYYTLTSIKEGVGGTAIRSSMLEFAQQFLGNPYVWGGTSLTKGADCSGFVQSIYAHYGYSLPRVAEDQAQYGMQIPIESAAPGDLIFYAKDGYIYHVVMYMGDGKVIHASSPSTGIIVSNIDTTHAVWATRVIDDSDTPNVQVTSAMLSVQAYSSATAADIGDYLGKFKLTAYCACSICCGQWADGITASGTVATEGRTVAMAGVPFGTKLIINGLVFTVEDRGTPYGHIDIFMTEHNRCLDFGVGSANIYRAN